MASTASDSAERDTANTPAPTATAVVVPGGYRVTGRQGFSTGCRHASWVAAHAQVLDNGKVRIDPETGQPEARYLYVPVGEADLEVIEEAAVRQSAHVRTYQIGPHGALCARILNEIALAKTVLLNPQKKKDYDAKLMVRSQPSVAVPTLIEALKDEVASVRQASARALAAIGADAKDAVPALTGLLNDPADIVRQDVVTALTEIERDAARKAGVK